jgi:hypothetical protein
MRAHWQTIGGHGPPYAILSPTRKFESVTTTLERERRLRYYRGHALQNSLTPAPLPEGEGFFLQKPVYEVIVVLLKCPAIFSKSAILLLLLACFTGCATVQKPLTGLVPGREVETLQSAIAISMKTGERGSGGRGFLIFKHPDRFHMAVLSPFGLTVLDVFSDGERLTCLVPSRQTAYTGLLSELPETGGLKSMGMMKWVVARPPVYDPSSGEGQVIAASGDRVFFDKNGLMQRKVSPEGDEVDYAGYRNVNGVAFPESIEIKNSYGDTVRIVFDEPEINSPVDNSTLAPNMEGIRVLPLSEFKGF